MNELEQLNALLRQFINKTEHRLEKLEVIHTRYTGSKGDPGPKGEKGDKGDPGKPCGELNEFRNERLAFREELHAFRNDLRDQFIKHTNDLSETHKRYADELGRAYTDGVRSLCELRDGKE